MFEGKKILIGVTGSIAAYKSILLVRLLAKAGAEVKVIMTPSATQFVSPLVLSTLSKNRVLLDLSDGSEWANHVELGRWADVFVIAPLTCNTLAKMAQGLCDSLLLATYLSATCPIVIAPAMDEDMWHHPSTKKNIATIESFGNHTIQVNNGELASGLYGEGRMAEPEEIITYLTEKFFRTKTLKGKQVLISAGPTYEALDPVRFIGNHSSGKMGFAIAEEMYLQGAEVILVTGPTHLQLNYHGIQRVNVVSAADMEAACNKTFPYVDIAVMSAAVADYTPSNVVSEKIKKKDIDWQLPLTRTPDILAGLGKQKKSNQFIAGFALETNNGEANALAKLTNKNTDCIILNVLNNTDTGFSFDTNKITILYKNGEQYHYELKPKTEVAKDIVSFIIMKTNA